MNKTKLIEDNMNLVYYIIHKYYPTYRNDEDLKQVGMLGLCKAADTWDGVSSKFSTYAFKCIVNTIRVELRNRSYIIPHISLDNQKFDNSDDSCYEFIASDEVDFLFNTQLESFIKTLKPREVELVNYMRLGLIQEEIAKKYNVTRQAISVSCRRIKSKWRKFNGED